MGYGLQDKTALVTGAATGIGRASALRLAQAIEADVSDAAAVQTMAEAVGAVDVLVNNAGIIQEKPFLETTEADWDRLLGVDLKAVLFLASDRSRFYTGQVLGPNGGSVMP